MRRSDWERRNGAPSSYRNGLERTVAASESAPLSVAAKVVMERPQPSSYGVPHQFDFSQYDRAIRNFKFKRQGEAVIFLVLIFGMATATITSPPGFLWSIRDADIASFCYFLFLVLFMPLFWMFYNSPPLEHFYRKRQVGLLRHSDQAEAFRADFAAWEFANSERGIGYWQVLRGIEFEFALATLFQRRGCRATTTKASGDGGVDLYLNDSNQEFWCQCKGYSKPVSVAPVREIAGVCSRSNAQAIIFAVNGFTRPALLTANELGVICIDAPELCHLAQFETISSIEASCEDYWSKAHR